MTSLSLQQKSETSVHAFSFKSFPFLLFFPSFNFHSSFSSFSFTRNMVCFRSNRWEPLPETESQRGRPSCTKSGGQGAQLSKMPGDGKYQKLSCLRKLLCLSYCQQVLGFQGRVSRTQDQSPVLQSTGTPTRNPSEQRSHPTYPETRTRHACTVTPKPPLKTRTRPSP